MQRLTLLSIALFSLYGCGGGGGGAGYQDLKLAPVSGVVKVNGQPVENPVVTFHPEKGPSGIGIGDAQGAFTVKTNGQKGAPVGKCKVTVTSSSGTDIPPSDGNEMQLLKKPRLSAKYAAPDTTDLIVDVPEEGNDNLQLDLDG